MDLLVIDGFVERLMAREIKIEGANTDTAGETAPKDTFLFVIALYWLKLKPKYRYFCCTSLNVEAREQTSS